MKKRKNPNTKYGVPIQNPVAKFANQFNKAHFFGDKNKYRRNVKHKKPEASPITLVRVIREASCGLEAVIRNMGIDNSLTSNASLTHF